MGAISVLVIALFFTAASAPAAPGATANLVAQIAVGTTVRAPIIPSGQTVTVRTLRFKAGMNMESLGPDPTRAEARMELPASLHWGTDGPDPAESCTGTLTTATCDSTYALDPNDIPHRAAGWIWDIVADAPGTYVLTAEARGASAADPDPSDNSSTVTVVVTESVRAAAVKLVPARPKAGSVVKAQVRFTAGREALRPEALRCTGTVGRTKLRAARAVATGTATCSYRTPRSAAGKTLRGALAFTFEGTSYVRRFTVRLG